MAHFVYIVRCADGSLYTGYARDPRARLAAHNAGAGAKYTCSRRPVRLVYTEALPTRSAALKREYELKQWTRARKQSLIRARRAEARERRLASSGLANSGEDRRDHAVAPGTIEAEDFRRRRARPLEE